MIALGLWVLGALFTLWCWGVALSIMGALLDGLLWLLGCAFSSPAPRPPAPAPLPPAPRKAPVRGPDGRFRKA